MMEGLRHMHKGWVESDSAPDACATASQGPKIRTMGSTSQLPCVLAETQITTWPALRASGENVAAV